VTRSYLEHFGLAEAPFSLTSDPRFIYGSRTFAAALDEVTTSVERRDGLIVITGGHGAGKTTLCRALIQHLPLATRLSAVPSPKMTAGDLVSQITADFGLSAVDELDRFLTSLVPAGALAVVIIDEAQQLEPAALDQIVLLTKLEAQGVKLLQIILVGQPDMRGVIERLAPDLDRRIAQRSVLKPLAPDEVGPYLARRLEVARIPEASDLAEVVVFSPDATDLIAGLSRGVPRIVNLLGDQALDIAADRPGRSVGRQSVLAAAARLQLARYAPETQTKARVAALAVVATLLAGMALALWWVPTARSGRGTAPGTAPDRAAVVSTPQVTSTPPPSVEPHAAEPPPVPAGPPTFTSPPTAVPAQPQPDPPQSAPIQPAPATPAGSLPPVGIPAIESFVLSVTHYRTVAEVADAVKRLSALGLPAFSRPGRLGREVIVGPYASREEALAAKAQMDELRDVKAQVIVELPSRRESK
jgi:general secretion pathway protein A